MFPKARHYRVCNPKSKKGKGTGSPIEKPTCRKYCKNHFGNCLKGMDNWFCCGKCEHKVRDCPNMRVQ